MCPEFVSTAGCCPGSFTPGIREFRDSPPALVMGAVIQDGRHGKVITLGERLQKWALEQQAPHTLHPLPLPLRAYSLKFTIRPHFKSGHQREKTKREAGKLIWRIHVYSSGQQQKGANPPRGISWCCKEFSWFVASEWGGQKEKRKNICAFKKVVNHALNVHHLHFKWNRMSNHFALCLFSNTVRFTVHFLQCLGHLNHIVYSPRCRGI